MQNLMTLYVGIECDDAGRQLDPAQRAKCMAALRGGLCGTFGGYTLAHTEGGWRNDAGRAVVEGTLRVEVYTDHGRGTCQEFARDMGQLFSQRCVLMEYRAAPGVDMIQIVEERQPCAA